MDVSAIFPCDSTSTNENTHERVALKSLKLNHVLALRCTPNPVTEQCGGKISSQKKSALLVYKGNISNTFTHKIVRYESFKRLNHAFRTPACLLTCSLCCCIKKKPRDVIREDIPPETEIKTSLSPRKITGERSLELPLTSDRSYMSSQTP